MAKVSPVMLAPPLIFAGLAVLMFLGLQREDPDALPSALEGKSAPAVEITQLGTGATFTDETLQIGRAHV